MAASQRVSRCQRCFRGCGLRPGRKGRLSPALNGQHSKYFQWNQEISLAASVLSLGRVHAKIGGDRMTYMFIILAMGPLAAMGIYNPQVMHHGRCMAEPGTINALYCPAPVAPSHHRHS
jgi:hypothetical protein